MTVTENQPPPEERPPLTGAELDAWVTGLSTAEAGNAILAAGLYAPFSGALWRPSLRRLIEPQEVPYVRWRLNRERLSVPARLVEPGIRVEPSFIDIPEEALEAETPVLRLAVEGDIVPLEVVPRILQAPTVAVAALNAVRPAAALRRRPWRWPLRIGVLGGGLVATDVTAAVLRLGGLNGDLVDVRDVAVEPAAVDVLFLSAPLRAAVDYVRAAGQLANAIVLLEPSSAAGWPEIDAQLAMLRATTGAVVSALGQASDPESITETVAGAQRRLILDMSRGHPFDAALTVALDRRALIVGELDQLETLDLPNLARDRAVHFRSTARLLAPRYRSAYLEPTLHADEYADAFVQFAEAAATEFDEVAQTSRSAESHDPSQLRVLTEQADDAVHDAAGPRLLQCYVGPAGSPSPAPAQNVLDAGSNAVDVFIGPQDPLALAAGELSDALLGLTPDIPSVQLTVVFAPIVPFGDPQRAELEVPRVGRSKQARFLLDVPSEVRQIAARIMVLHRNRVLQTAVLSGTPGAAAHLTELAVVHPDLARLDDRSAFDLALVANHVKGKGYLYAYRDGLTEVSSLTEIEAIAERMRKVLIKAAFLPGRGGKPSAEKTLPLLIDLAVKGNDLYSQLESYLQHFGDFKRIQIITARSGLFLPLELVYSRVAPKKDAKLCASWEAGGNDCSPSCGSGPNDSSIICPASFWGLSRTIERHYLDANEGEPGAQYLARDVPSANRRKLTTEHAAVGASSKVPNTAVLATVKKLGADTRRVTTWDSLTEALEQAPSDVLVLMPHTDASEATIEISRDPLERGRIEFQHVTGGHEGAHPIVMLLGCDTAGSADDPTGFATRVKSKNAAVVITTFTMLSSTHAVTLAQSMMEMLQDPGRAEQPVGELFTTFRQKAVREGLLAAIALTAYGDADWTA